MEQKADLQFVEPLRKKLKKLSRNSQCIYPGCEEEPISSHIIAESVLKLLADQGNVLTMERSDDDLIVNAIRGQKWEHAYKQPKSIGIGKQATYPIFCSRHDNTLFEPLEQPGYPSEPHQIVL